MKVVAISEPMQDVCTSCSNSLIPTHSSPACCEAKSLEGWRGRRRQEDDLSTVNGDVIGVETETGLLVNEEIHDLLALVTLELDHLSGLFVVDLVAIASYRKKSQSVEHVQKWCWGTRLSTYRIPS
jgi:hypothetical protein